jgi:hypothetical protein
LGRETYQRRYESEKASNKSVSEVLRIFNEKGTMDCCGGRREREVLKRFFRTPRS